MDLIEKDKLIEILAEMQGRCATKTALVQNSKIWQQVKDMPTVDAEPVRHGKWIVRIGAYHEEVIDCSVCGDSAWSLVPYENLVRSFKYCPNCGARMDEEKQE